MERPNNRLEIYTSDKQVVIQSNPYKSSKYLIRFALYIFCIAALITCLIYRNEIFFSSLPMIIQMPIFIFLGGSMIMFSLMFLPLFFSIIKGSVYKNLFFSEQLIVYEDKLKYNNSFGRKKCWNLPSIEEIYFEFNKPVGEFSGVPRLLPNYKATVKINNRNTNIYEEIMHSIKEEEIPQLYTIITNHLVKIGYVFHQSNVDYKDQIKDIRHWGKKIKLISHIPHDINNI